MEDGIEPVIPGGPEICTYKHSTLERLQKEFSAKKMVSNTFYFNKE